MTRIEASQSTESGPSGSPDSGDASQDDVLKEIRANAPQKLIEMFSQEAEEDEEQFRVHCEALTDEDIDPLAEKIGALTFPLPSFTTKLSPESLVGYFYLAQQEDPELGKLMEAVGEWMQATGEKVGGPGGPEGPEA